MRNAYKIIIKAFCGLKNMDAFRIGIRGNYAKETKVVLSLDGF